jgi:hypothetical protein
MKNKAAALRKIITHNKNQKTLTIIFTNNHSQLVTTQKTNSKEK